VFSAPRAGAVPRVKVCCIASVEEAWLAIHLGASAIGLVSRMPSGPGPIDDARIAEIAARVPPGVSSFLLTCETDVDLIADQQRRAGTNTLQLVDELPAGAHRRLRSLLPGVAIVQVVHVMGDAAVDEARRVAADVDGILLDSGNPAAPVKELGGTGRRHDWSISRRIREAVNVPVFLAGGLRPGNVAEAIREVRPFGVDACSGLRVDGRLDESLVSGFIREARGAVT
jgi:phosphoribosylanthranilate isomerase